MDHHQSHSSHIEPKQRKIQYRIFWVLCITGLLCHPAWAESEDLGTAEPATEVPTIAIPATEAPLQTERKWGAVISSGVPNLFNIATTHRFSSNWRGLITTGFMSLPLGNSRAARASNLEVQAQWHPFQGAFYLGVGLGYQSIGFQTQLNLSSISSDFGNQLVEMRIENIFIGPRLGFFWQKQSGFLIGFEIGAQVPLLTRGGMYTLDDGTSTPLSQSLESSTQETLNYFASLVIPMVTLFRIGWVLPF